MPSFSLTCNTSSCRPVCFSGATTIGSKSYLLSEILAFATSLRSKFSASFSLRRTHCTLFQEAGGSLRDAQAQLGHSKMSATLEVYTIPIDTRRREVVKKVDCLVTNGDEFRLRQQGPRMPTNRVSRTR